MDEQQPYIRLRSVDASGSLGVQRIHIRRGSTVTAAHAAATNLRGRMRGCTDCSYFSQSVVYPAADTYTPNPLAESNAERHAVFVFSTDTAEQYAIIAVAGMKDEILLTEGNTAGVEINREHPAVAALVAELTNGSWCNKFGYIITTLEVAYLQERHAVFVPDWLS